MQVDQLKWRRGRRKSGVKAEEGRDGGVTKGLEAPHLDRVCPSCITRTGVCFHVERCVVNNETDACVRCAWVDIQSASEVCVCVCS